MADEREGRQDFVRRVLVITGIVVVTILVLYVLRRVTTVVLVAFAGILLGVFLDGVAMWIAHHTRFRREIALLLAIAFFFAALVAIFWLAGAPIGTQIASLVERMPTALETLRTNLSRSEWGRQALQWVPEPDELLPSNGSVLRGVGGVFATAVTTIINVILVLVLGIYMAATPSLYVDNAIRLFPKSRRERMRKVVSALGGMLRWWLVGRVSSMIVVGLLTGIGLWIAGVPLPLALALIAGLLAFIPFLGPVFGAIPAILVALTESPITALYALLVFIVVQILETYLITPLIQQRAISIAPALLISAQILMAVLFGGIGILLAAPFALVVIVLVQMLYVQDVLGDPVKVLGERQKSRFRRFGEG